MAVRCGKATVAGTCARPVATRGAPCGVDHAAGGARSLLVAPDGSAAAAAAADPFAAPERPVATAPGVPSRDDERARWKAGEAPSAPAQDLLRAWHPDLTIDLSEKDDLVELSRIVVPATSRESGAGSAAMDDLVAYADASGKTVACTPSSDFGGSKGRLEKFYRRFGFVPNKGRNKDFSTRESMVRPPR